MVENKPTLEEEFKKLVDMWQQDTNHLSNIRSIINHPAYREIIRMGRPALPLILRQLQQNPVHLFSALAEINGEDIASGTHTFDQALEQWLAWGRGQGLFLDEQ